MTLYSVLRHPWFTWALLALPATLMLAGLIGGDATPHQLLHPTGEFSARAMILALYCSPLCILFPRVRLFKSLMRRRRYLGVAAFGYALLHTILYIVDRAALSSIVAEVAELSIWTGWLAFLIFVPLAITSSDGWVRRLKARWKSLQRWVYAAAVLTAAHWLFLDYHWGPVLVHFAPLAALEAARVIKQRRRRSAGQPAAAIAG